MIRPDEQWFPGIDKTREEFESFNWIFGRTPNFKVCLGGGLFFFGYLVYFRTLRVEILVINTLYSIKIL